MTLGAAETRELINLSKFIKIWFIMAMQCVVWVFVVSVYVELVIGFMCPHITGQLQQNFHSNNVRW